MQNLWRTEEAQKFTHSPLEMRAYTSRLLGQNDDLVLHGGGNTSVKHAEKNIFGEMEEILYVKGSGHDLKTIQTNGFSPTRLSALKKLAALKTLTDTQMMRELKVAQTDPAAPTPSVEAILHAIIPFKYVDHTHADSVVAISNSKNGEETIRGLFAERVLVLPYIMPGFILSKQVFEATQGLDWSKYDAIILLNHGVFTFHDDAKVAYDNMINICHRAEEYLKKTGAWDKQARAQAQSFSALEIATLRKQVSDTAKTPLIASIASDELSVGYASLPGVEKFGCDGPITPDHVLHTKRIPMVLGTDTAKDVERYASDYSAYFNQNKTTGLTCLDPAPRYALWSGRGIVHFAPTAKRLQIVRDIVSHTAKAVQWGQALGGWKALPPKDIFELEYWELEQAKLKTGKAAPQFEGRVALVSGAASGIGKTCAQTLLAQGAAVIGLDINPEIEKMALGGSFFGIKCDITDTQAIRDSLGKGVQRFGGIDILVSNAGTFPPSKSIEETDDAFWDKTLDVNLGGHFKVLRESVPYLKVGIRPSVVVVGSKNVPAPGPGVAGYSASKAGLTQLARVAAMELGKYGIRVNVIHPNAVFDTGIWGEDVIAKRATSYGLSVDEYKRNNILKTEITSKDISEVICLLASDSFSKMTGAQLPLDGGNDRVI